MRKVGPLAVSSREKGAPEVGVREVGALEVGAREVDAISGRQVLAVVATRVANQVKDDLHVGAQVGRF